MSPRMTENLGFSPAAGKILPRTEGFERFVRKFESHPLTK